MAMAAAVSAAISARARAVSAVSETKAPISVIFSKVFSAVVVVAMLAADRSAVSAGAARRRKKGANVAYRLSVSFIDAATQAPQRIALADGATIDLKLPAGVETGTQMRLAGNGAGGAGR